MPSTIQRFVTRGGQFNLVLNLWWSSLKYFWRIQQPLSYFKLMRWNVDALWRQRFAAVIMRIREPKTTALIFASGKMVRMICTHISDTLYISSIVSSKFRDFDSRKCRLFICSGSSSGLKRGMVGFRFALVLRVSSSRSLLQERCDKFLLIWRLWRKFSFLGRFLSWFFEY